MANPDTGYFDDEINVDEIPRIVKHLYYFKIRVCVVIMSRMYNERCLFVALVWLFEPKPNLSKFWIYGRSKKLYNIVLNGLI